MSGLEVITPYEKLRAAVQADDLERVERLLAMGLNPNLLNTLKKIWEDFTKYNSRIDLYANYLAKPSPLFIAVKERNLRMVTTLLEAGALPDIAISPIGGYTPLLQACRFGDTDIARKLLEHGANPDLSAIHAQTEDEYDVDPDSDSGESPLYAAILSQNIDLIRLLLEKNANPNQVCYLGWFYCQHPLFTAALTNNMDVLKLLLSHHKIKVSHIYFSEGEKERMHPKMLTLIEEKKEQEVRFSPMRQAWMTAAYRGIVFSQAGAPAPC